MGILYSICVKKKLLRATLRHLMKATTYRTAVIAYYSIFESHVSYGLLVWGAFTKIMIYLKYILQKRTVGILCAAHYLESCRQQVDADTDIQIDTYSIRAINCTITVSEGI